MSTVTDRLDSLHLELEETYGHKKPLLVAVSKTVDSSVIREAYESGQKIFGENRVPVLIEKAEHLQDLTEISWHFIGRLQRNKIRKIIALVSMIHSVDSLKLAEAISRIAIEEDLPPVKILLEVNTSLEESKAGFTETALRKEMDSITALKGVTVEGFMTMAPFTADETIVRSTFRALKEISESYSRNERVGNELSMGMTNDYPIAIDEGATIIRVGSKIFSEGQV